MQITDVIELKYIHTETNRGAYYRYIRYSPENWYKKVLDSNVLLIEKLTENDRKEMEKLYQEWLAKNGGETSNQSDIKQVTRQYKKFKPFSTGKFQKIR